MKIELTKFRTTHDGEQMNLSKRMVDAIKELMLAEIEQMRNGNPDTADCWTWGLASFKDIGNSDWLIMQFGGDEDRPNCGINEIIVRL